MKLSRRHVLRGLSVIGTSIATARCTPSPEPVPPPTNQSPVLDTGHDGGFSSQSRGPIRFSIEGLAILRPEKEDRSVTGVDIALLNPRANESLQLPRHFPTLSVPRALIGGYNVQPVSSDSTYMHWNLDGQRIATVVRAGATEYAPGGHSKITWNDVPRNLFSCPNTQDGFRSLAWVPHLSEFSQALKPGWDQLSHSTTIIKLPFGAFEPADLELSLFEEFDKTRWIFTRSRDGASRWVDGEDQPQGRALKNVVTAALGGFDTLRFDFTGKDGSTGYVSVNATAHTNAKFDPVNQPILVSNLSGPHPTPMALHDFLAYYEPTGSQSIRERYFPTSKQGCVMTIECGCCPPSIAD
ncbi:MAG TPA: hypothetical protein VEA16_16790 [Vicinamibacterales bacterium]|nr:hypothetical protein [Vicinamibacterales bacterium]